MANRSIQEQDRIIGENIRRIRRLRGMTQTDLCKDLGFSYQQMQKYENAANRVSGSRLIEIARRLECSVMDLFEGAIGDLPGEPREPEWYESKGGMLFCQNMGKLNDRHRIAIIRLVATLVRESE